MLLKIEVGDDRPLYRQIAAAARRAVRNGEIGRGERLPAARDLAASLDVNMHTVLRAYGLLKDEGVVELRRGRGAVVIGLPPDEELDRLVAELMAEARRQGLSPAEIAARITEEYS